jgi:hypothetical protein
MEGPAHPAPVEGRMLELATVSLASLFAGFVDAIGGGGADPQDRLRRVSALSE